MSNINNLTLSKFYLDAILTKSEAAKKSWTWLLVDEVVPEKEIVKYVSDLKS